MKRKLIVAAAILKMPCPVKAGKGTLLQRISEVAGKEKTTLPTPWRIWRWNLTLHTSTVLSLGRSLLAAQGRNWRVFAWTKTLSFRVATSQLSN